MRLGVARRQTSVEALPRSGASGTSCALPLTPALSRRERENGSQPLLTSSPSSSSECWMTWPPLPAGEGRGEGERFDQLRNAATSARGPSPRQRGSVLIIVLWIAFGLVSLALYFAHSMSFELRAADNRVAGTEAEQAIEGAARYLTNILANVQQPGTPPDTNAYHYVSVPVGDATFWVIGRDDTQRNLDQPAFGLVDEASKLNLNTATLEMLQSLHAAHQSLLRRWVFHRRRKQVTRDGADEIPAAVAIR